MLNQSKSSGMPIASRKDRTSSSLLKIVKYLKVDKISARVKTLKRQLDDTEEEVARANANKRKLQRDYDDLMEHNEALQREVTLLRNKIRQVDRLLLL